jgi:hypothetical protein
MIELSTALSQLQLEKGASETSVFSGFEHRIPRMSELGTIIAVIPFDPAVDRKLSPPEQRTEGDQASCTRCDRLRIKYKVGRHMSTCKVVGLPLGEPQLFGCHAPIAEGAPCDFWTDDIQLMLGHVLSHGPQFFLDWIGWLSYYTEKAWPMFGGTRAERDWLMGFYCPKSGCGHRKKWNGGFHIGSVHFFDCVRILKELFGAEIVLFREDESGHLVHFDPLEAKSGVLEPSVHEGSAQCCDSEPEPESAEPATTGSQEPKETLEDELKKRGSGDEVDIVKFTAPERRNRLSKEELMARAELRLSTKVSKKKKNNRRRRRKPWTHRWWEDPEKVTNPAVFFELMIRVMAGDSPFLAPLSQKIKAEQKKKRRGAPIKYSAEDIVRIIVYATVSQFRSISEFCEMRKRLEIDVPMASINTILRRINMCYPGLLDRVNDWLMDMFLAHFGRFDDIPKERRKAVAWVNPKKKKSNPQVVYIVPDGHNQPYYGKEDELTKDWLSRANPKAHTNKFFAIEAIYAVAPGLPVLLRLDWRRDDPLAGGRVKGKHQPSEYSESATSARALKVIAKRLPRDWKYTVIGDGAYYTKRFVRACRGLGWSWLVRGNVS